jgi:hypothetical protein
LAQPLAQSTQSRPCRIARQGLFLCHFGQASRSPSTFAAQS